MKKIMLFGIKKVPKISGSKGNDSFIRKWPKRALYSLFVVFSLLAFSSLVGSAAPTQSLPWLAAELEAGNSLTSHGYNETIVGYWKLNRYGSSDESKVLDETGVNNGTPTNFDNTSSSGPTYSGRIGGAWNFDGVDDYVNITDFDEDISSMTITTWFKINDLSRTVGDESHIIVQQLNRDASTGRTLFAIIEDTNKLFSNIGGALFDGDTTILTDIWYHTAVTFNTTTITLYLNGVEDGSTTDTLECSTCPLVIGSGTTKTEKGYFNGSIDEVSIWNVSLSAEEINKLYLDGLVNKSETVYTTQDLGASSNNTADADNDNLTSIFNWYEDNVSLTVLNMPFDSNNSNSTGSTKDYSGYGNAGKIVGAVWNATGGIDKDIPNVFSGAYEFDGVDDYIDIPNLGLGSTDSITLGAWINLNKRTDRFLARAYGSNSNARSGSLDLNTGGIPGVIFVNTTGDGHSCNGITDVRGSWYHVIGVIDIDNQIQKIYVNGIEENSCSIVGDSSTGSGTFLIGQNGAGTPTYENGSIDEVQIYNRSLSAEEIKQLYLKNYNVLVAEETKTFHDYRADITINDGTDDSPTLSTATIRILAKPEQIYHIILRGYDKLTLRT